MDEIERKITEAIERSYNDGYEDGLRDGAEEAWQFVKCMDKCDADEREWLIDEYPNADPVAIFDTHAEAKKEFEEWKANHKWEPKVGDVAIYDVDKVVIMKQTLDGYYVMWADGSSDWDVSASDLKPTGEHIDLTPILSALKS